MYRQIKILQPILGLIRIYRYLYIKLNMNDFLKQMKTLRRMGPMKQLLGMLPGVGAALKNVDIDDAQFNRLEGMVHSMTSAEREDVKLLSKSRNRRIARGSGTQPNEVNRLVSDLEGGVQLREGGGVGRRGEAAEHLARPGEAKGREASPPAVPLRQAPHDLEGQFTRPGEAPPLPREAEA